jgi:hypothetical protein
MPLTRQTILHRYICATIGGAFAKCGLSVKAAPTCRALATNSVADKFLILNLTFDLKHLRKKAFVIWDAKTAASLS